MYLAATAIGLLLLALDVLEASLLAAVAVGAIGGSSAFALRSLAGRIRGGLHLALFLTIDIALVSLTVAVTGGRESPWFPWYIAIVGAAAFVGGQSAAFLAFLGSTVGYVTALVGTGDVAGPGAPLWNALAVMACLYAASFFFLRGAEILQVRGARIRAMERDGRRKVEELTRLTEVLEERTRDLEEANLRLREADRLKTQFLANVSHELRTPLNSIIGFSEILRGQLREALDPRQERFLGHIQSSGERLLSIIDDILDLSKIESGTLDLAPERVPVRSSIEGVCTVLKGTAAQKGIRLAVTTDDDVPVLAADPARFKQALYHLVSNAVKFSHAEGEVSISARWRPPGESPLGVECVVIDVVDRGVGIAPGNLDTIFEPFRQVDGTASREYQGAGLGLALVRRMVELHGGRVSVESALGKGSTFRVFWPVELPGSEDGSPPSGDSPNGESLDGDGILVVEDDPTSFEALRDPLSSSGFRVLRARTGEEALELARRAAPAAITLDLVLPGLDGFATLRRLREDPETREIPVVIVSMLENHELGMALGADEYLVKPVDPEILLETLRSLVSRSSPGDPRILVIDDDVSLHELLEATLPERYELLRALSGHEGLERAQREAVDLILLDLMMEEMDGFEVAARLKESEATRDIPIVVLTAMDLGRDDRERLHDKIEALIQKGGGDVARLDLLIRQATRRRMSRARS